MKKIKVVILILMASVIATLLVNCGGVSINENKVKVDKIPLSGTASEFIKPISGEYILHFNKEESKISVRIPFEITKKLTQDKEFSDFSLNVIDASGNSIDLKSHAFNNCYSLKPLRNAKIGEKVEVEFSLVSTKITSSGVDYDLANNIMENTKGFKIENANIIKDKYFVPEKKKIYAIEGKKIFGPYGNCLELIDTVMNEGFINYVAKSYQSGSFVQTDKFNIAAIKKNNTNRCFLKIDFYDQNKNKIKELISLENGGDIYGILANGEGTTEVSFCEPLNSTCITNYQKYDKKIYYFKISTTR